MIAIAFTVLAVAYAEISAALATQKTEIDALKLSLASANNENDAKDKEIDAKDKENDALKLSLASANNEIQEHEKENRENLVKRSKERSKGIKIISELEIQIEKLKLEVSTLTKQIEILQADTNQQISAASQDTLPHALYTMKRLVAKVTNLNAQLDMVTNDYYVQQAELRDLRDD